MGGKFGRCLEEAGHQSGFRHGDFAYGFAEIILRRSFDTKSTAAHVSAVEIEFQDFALGVAAFEQERKKQFLHFAFDRTFGREKEVLGELLGDRRTALHDIVGLDVGQQGTRCAVEIDADVFEEAAVFGGERRLDEGIWNIVERHGVVMQDAALAELVAVGVQKLDRELAG